MSKSRERRVRKAGRGGEGGERDGLSIEPVVHWFSKLNEVKRYPLCIGIDPGASGAIAFLCPLGYRVFDMPTVKKELKAKAKSGKPKTQTDYDLNKIVDLFYGLQGWKGSVRACVEVALPQKGTPFKFTGPGGRRAIEGGKSAWGSYRSGMSWYMWPLFLKSKGIVVRETHPITWKTKAKLLGKGKGVSLRKARKRFPDAELRLKKHEGRAEALLLARHAMLLYEEEQNG